jgi:hypothetical protein
MRHLRKLKNKIKIKTAKTIQKKVETSVPKSLKSSRVSRKPRSRAKITSTQMIMAE